MTADNPSGGASHRLLPQTPPHPFVTDDVDAAESLAMMLTMIGHETQTVHDRLQALDVHATFKADVMFLDIAMPKFNGYEVGRRIRRLA